LIVVASLLAALLVFGKARALTVSPSFGHQFRTVDYSDLPALEYYRARDGVSLAYRSYRAPAASAGPQKVAVLIHGASDSSAGMHVVARALLQEGITSYVPDLRGHGANQPHGNIRYPGQLDDDLIDLMKEVRPRHSLAQWILVGFSAGGGFALRIDGSEQGRMFDRYLLLAPGLRFDGPTARPLASQDTDAQRFVAPYTGRLIAITLLRKGGLHWFDGLPVLAFAVPGSERFTASYSMRLLENFAPHDDYLADIRNIHRATVVLVGSNDEFLLAENFAPVFHSQRDDVVIQLLPGLGHLDLVTSPEAMRAITAVVR
jgi:pimeloyl-ACP methyl ester carboxylesterase